MYTGWARGGAVGATLAGLGFVGPSLLMVLVLPACYVRFGGLRWMQGVFYGTGAAVIAVIARGAAKLLRSTVARDPVLWIVVAVNAAVVVWTEAEIFWVFAASGLVTLVVQLGRERGTGPTSVAASLAPWCLVTGLHGAASFDTMAGLLGFFAKAAIVVFGSGLAVVPFLQGAASSVTSSGSPSTSSSTPWRSR